MLVVDPSHKTPQGVFEETFVKLGVLRRGALAIHSDGSRYVSDETQSFFDSFCQNMKDCKSRKISVDLDQHQE